MLRMKGSRLTVAVLAAVVVVLVMGGAAVASTLGFKIHKAWAFAGLGQIGDNWTGLPLVNPYTSVGSFCTQVGLVSTGAVGQPRAIITMVRADTGVASSFTCGSAAANGQPLPSSSRDANGKPNDARGIRVRQPNVAGALSSGIIVGALHNPDATFVLADAGGGTAGDNWLSVPVGHLASGGSFAAVCSAATGLALTSTGPVGAPRAQVTRVDAGTGIATSVTCGSAAAGTVFQVLGEAIRVREPNGPYPAAFWP